MFRNCAPLFIAHVDPDLLCALRETEQILMSETGLDLASSFGVVEINPIETWIVSPEMGFPMNRMNESNRGLLAECPVRSIEFSHSLSRRLRGLSMTVNGGAILVVLVAVNLQAGETSVASRDELFAALRDAKAGDVIRVAAGTYRGGIELRGIHGTESAPVRLVAADAKKPPLFDGGASGLHITDSSFLEINGLHLRNATGNGINIDEGGAGQPAARGIVLRNLVVSDVGPKGNRDGIKLSGLDNFKVEDCRVERWGTGGSGLDMVGCHDGVISGCSFQRDAADKEGAQQANGVQMKGGSARIVVRRCLFKNAGGRSVNLGGSTGKEYFRPLGADHEARDLTVEDCQFIGGMTPVAFVGVDQATVRYNTIYHPGRWGLRILQENRGPEFVPSRNGVFSNNIVVFRSDQLAETVNIGPGTAPETFTFADNVWYCDDRPDQSQRRVRLPVSEKNGTYGVDPLLAEPVQDRLNLAANSPVKNAGVRLMRPAP